MSTDMEELFRGWKKHQKVRMNTLVFNGKAEAQPGNSRIITEKLVWFSIYDNPLPIK